MTRTPDVSLVRVTTGALDLAERAVVRPAGVVGLLLSSPLTSRSVGTARLLLAQVLLVSFSLQVGLVRLDTNIFHIEII